jgi:hypothetical protein
VKCLGDQLFGYVTWSHVISPSYSELLPGPKDRPSDPDPCTAGREYTTATIAMAVLKMSYSARQSLASAMRNLSLRNRSSIARWPIVAPQQRRALSATVPSSAQWKPSNHDRQATGLSVPSRAVSRTTVPVSVQVTRQQTRGMKVQSSIKKRCEHCKVCAPALGGIRKDAQFRDLTTRVRLSGEKAENDIGATSTSSALRIRDTNSDRADL